VVPQRLTRFLRLMRLSPARLGWKQARFLVTMGE
jgi:hypothetical protein